MKSERPIWVEVAMFTWKLEIPEGYLYRYAGGGNGLVFVPRDDDRSDPQTKFPKVKIEESIHE